MKKILLDKQKLWQFVASRVTSNKKSSLVNQGRNSNMHICVHTHTHNKKQRTLRKVIK